MHHNETDQLEIGAIEYQQRWFSRTSIGVIVVSFVHMFMALALFSSPLEPGTWGFIVWIVERLAAAGMTLSVDIVTWRLAEYHHYAQRNELARSPWVRRLFNVALGISMFLNGAYLWVHAPKDLNPIIGGMIALLFALFIPMTIGVFSLINGELEDDKHKIAKRIVQRAAEASAPQLAPEPARPPRPLPMKPRKPRQLPAVAPLAPAAPAAAVDTTHLADLTAVEVLGILDTIDDHQEATPVPASDLAYNAKLGTDDLGGILERIRQAGVSSFKSGRELMTICGWGSAESGSKGLRTLIDAGAVVKEESSGMYVLAV